jgi:type IV pilus assembly protein PilO
MRTDFFHYGCVFSSLIVLVFLNYWWVIKPQLAQYNLLQQDQIQLTNDYAKRQHLGQLKGYQNQLTELKRRYNNYLKQRVKESEVFPLVQQISQAGLSSGLVFKLLAPSSKLMKKDYFLRIEVLGEYPQLAHFLSKIAALRQLLSIERFEVSKLLKNRLTMKLNLIIYLSQ